MCTGEPAQMPKQWQSVCLVLRLKASLLCRFIFQNKKVVVGGSPTKKMPGYFYQIFKQIIQPYANVSRHWERRASASPTCSTRPTLPRHQNQTNTREDRKTTALFIHIARVKETHTKILPNPTQQNKWKIPHYGQVTLPNVCKDRLLWENS